MFGKMRKLARLEKTNFRVQRNFWAQKIRNQQKFEVADIVEGINSIEHI